MLTFPTISVLAAIAPIRILRAKLFGTPAVDRLGPATALLREEGDGVPDCVFFCHDYTSVEEPRFLRYFWYSL